MKIKVTKYCIMTEDRKQIEVGQSRNYHFIPIEDLEKSKSKMQLFNSYKVARASFLNSWCGVSWDEDKQIFRCIPDNFIIVKVIVTYEL